MPSSGIPIDPSCIHQFKQFESRNSELQWVMFCISNDAKPKIVPEHSGTSLQDFDAVLQLLPDNDCRYVFFKVHFDKVELDAQTQTMVHAGKRTKVVMVNWCPMAATVKHRFAYASSRSDLCKSIQYQSSLHVQAGIKQEVTYDSLVKKCKEVAF